MRKKFFLLLLLLPLLAAAYAFLRSGEPQGDGLLTQAVTSGSISETVSAVGSLNPVQIITVGTQVTGQVNKLYVQANDTVEQGQLMAEIDPSLVRTALQQSEAALSSAQDSFTLTARTLERTRALAKEDFVSKAELERAELDYKTSRSSVEAARARVESDRVNLNYTTIRAPVAGVVIAQEITEGQTVSASLSAPTLFKIAADLRKMKIEIALSEADIGRVKEQQKVQFTVDAFPGRDFTGLITKVMLNPNISGNVVTYAVLVEVENEDRALLPGMTAYVNIIVDKQENTLRVPNAAFRFTPARKPPSALHSILGMAAKEEEAPQTTKPGGRIVYVVRGGALVPLEVETGITDGKVTEAKTGLSAGDKVAVGYAYREE